MNNEELLKSIEKSRSVCKEIIDDFKKHELDKHTEGVCDGLQMAMDIITSCCKLGEEK